MRGGGGGGKDRTWECAKCDVLFFFFFFFFYLRWWWACRQQMSSSSAADRETVVTFSGPEATDDCLSSVRCPTHYQLVGGDGRLQAEKERRGRRPAIKQTKKCLNHRHLFRCVPLCATVTKWRPKVLITWLCPFLSSHRRRYWRCALFCTPPHPLSFYSVGYRVHFFVIACIHSSFSSSSFFPLVTADIFLLALSDRDPHQLLLHHPCVCVFTGR